MASCPITSWQVDGETVETVAGLIFLGSKITAGGDCSPDMTNLNSILKSRDITLPTKFHLVKAMVFPVVMYRGPAAVDPGNSKRGRRRRGSGNNCLIKC